MGVKVTLLSIQKVQIYTKAIQDRSIDSATLVVNNHFFINSYINDKCKVSVVLNIFNVYTYPWLV